MDVSYNPRVTTTTASPENYNPAESYDGDSYYAELKKHMFQLMEDDDCKSIVDSSHRNPSENYRSVPVPPFPAVTMPPRGDFYRMRNFAYRPNYWRPALPAINRHGSNRGGGTGVFIPLPTDRVGPTGRERRMRERINKTSDQSNVNK